MYVITKKGMSSIQVECSLVAALHAAVGCGDGCWLWQLAVTRVGTLKRIEVPREELTEVARRIGLEIGGIANRFQRDIVEPVEGQLYFTTEAEVKTYTQARRDLSAAASRREQNGAG